MDQSKAWTACLSWFVFILFAIVVPCLSHFFLACSDCDNKHSRPFDAVVQLSLSSLATLSFLSLTQFVRKYGLRRFLFFDKLCDESETVRTGYTRQLNVSLFPSLYICTILRLGHCYSSNLQVKECAINVEFVRYRSQMYYWKY